MRISSQQAWIRRSDEESLASLRRALELGVNFIDTALAYGDGHSEELVGQVVRSAPQRFTSRQSSAEESPVAGKAGIEIGEVFPREYVIRSTEESLRNLQLERIDLQHCMCGILSGPIPMSGGVRSKT